MTKCRLVTQKHCDRRLSYTQNVVKYMATFRPAEDGLPQTRFVTDVVHSDLSRSRLTEDSLND